MITQVKRGWRADFWLGTHRVRKTLPTKKLAEILEVTKKNEYLMGKYVPQSKKDKTPFREFADEFYRLHCAVNMQKPEKTVFYHLEKLKTYFGEKRLSDVTQRDIEEWKADFSTKAEPSTVNRQLTTLKSLFRKAVQWNKLPSNPAKSIAKLRENSGRTRYLTEQEIRRLYEVATLKLQQFLTLALNSGMRKSNLVNLQWEDIDFRNGVIHVIKTKSGKSYDVPINNALIGLFKQLSKEKKSGRVLDTTNLRGEFIATFQKADIKDCTLHDLRHTFASHLAMKGIDLYTISQLLGHSDIKMTQRYAHLTPNHKKIAVNMIHFADDAKNKQGQELKVDYSTN